MLHPLARALLLRDRSGCSTADSPAGRRRAWAGGAVHGLARAGAGARHGRARRGGLIQRRGRARRGGRHGRAHEDDAEKHARWSWMRAGALPPVLDRRRHHRGGRGCRETRRAGLWPPHSGAGGRGCRVTQRLKTCAAAPLCSRAHAMRRRACPPASCRGRASSRNRSARERADNVLKENERGNKMNQLCLFVR